MSIVVVFLSAVLLFVQRGAIPNSLAWALIGSGLAVAVVGCLDDYFRVSAWLRILIHFAAAGWALWQLNGMGSLHLGWIIWDWGWVGQLVALVGLVWMINLYNFMDGIDGLAGLEALSTAGLGAMIMAWSGLGGLAEGALALAGASAGFLVWNLSPARVFMGDVGSGFIGLAFGVLAISSAKERPWLLWPWLILLSVFVVDSTLTVIRRLVGGAKWYEAHRNHAYQHAARRWGSHLKVTLTIAAINVGWLFPLAWGASVWRATAPLFALVALAPVVYMAVRYGAGQDTSATEVPRTEVEGRLAAGSDQSPNSKLNSSPSSEDAHRRIEVFIQRAARHLTSQHRHGLTARRVQPVLVAVAGVLAFLLRFDFSVPRQYWSHLLAALCVWVPLKVLVFHVLRSDRGWWRYVSTRDVARLLAANVAGSFLGCLVLLGIAPEAFPRSIYFLDLLTCLGMTALARVTVRLAFEFSQLSNPGTKQRTLIYGAGDAGVALLREIRQNSALAYEIVGFIDDDPAKAAGLIHGARVFGNGAALPSIVASHAIETVLIALPSATGTQMTTVLNYCHKVGVSYKTVPSLTEIIEGAGLAARIRDVAVEDLLGRTPARLEHDRISQRLTGHTILVTGAAGSIGSELCHQIARFNPGAIVGFDIAETALFHLDREMRRSFPNVSFCPEVGSIQSKQRVAEVLEQYRPSVLYHAAAYKHVPMMETHVFEAVENNVFGTWNIALAAAHHGVDHFVMISSDKAVRPTNIMGATKRVAELLILELQNGGTSFVSVRFGNVLGSNGSVIPIFKQQIAAGGPVTVTHPEMRRYFMTIPEASQLVLQASTMGRGGEIFVLDLGAPVKIVDLARNLILLSGLRPDEDIRIEFTGVRPGEKLYEEFNSMEEETLPTRCEKIKIFTGNGLPSTGMERYLEALRDICARRDVPELVLTLKELIPDYNPSAQLLRRVVDLQKTAVTAGPRTKAAAW